MSMNIDEILQKANELTLETLEDSITPPRVGELVYGLAEIIKQGISVSSIGASKLSELEDVSFLNQKENDILQKIGNKWTNMQFGETNLSNLLKNVFISKKTDDTAEGLIDFIKGIEIGDFTSGFLGGGGSLKMTPDGMSELEVDKLTVRMVATFFELVIRKISHVGGELILSPARMKCTSVVEEANGYRCYFNNDNGNIANEFVVNDQARCQVFSGAGVKSYWRLVTEIGADYIKLSKTDANGTGIPAIGDDIIQLGNRTNDARQNAQILSTVGSDAPSYKQYSGISSYNLTGKERTVFSATGNTIVGNLKITNNGIETDIKDYVDNIQVGGRNLVRKGGELVINSDYPTKSYDLSETTKIGEIYTYQIKGELAEGQTYWLFYCYDWIQFGMMFLDEKYDSVRGIYYGTFTATRAINRISVFSYPEVAGDAKIEWVKLEKGNKATDWTPAPEDVQAEIEATQLFIEYSADGTNWHFPYQIGDIYLHQKIGVNSTWGSAIKFVGADGTSISIKGHVANYASLPTSGMSVGDGYVTDDNGHLCVYMPDLTWSDAGTFRGTDGLPSYIHVAYASNSDGTQNFSTSDPANRDWMGVYSDNIADDKTNPALYKWKYVKGNAGADATVYELVCSSYVANQNLSGAYTPGTLTFSGLKTIGNNAPTMFGGIYKIYRNGTLVYTSITSELSTTHTITAGTTEIKVELYLASVKVDEATIAITSDGAEGKNAISCALSNGSHSIPCDKDGNPTSYISSGTKIYVTEADAYLMYVTEITGNSQFTVSALASGITAGAISAGTNPACAVVANHSGMTANPATIIYTVTTRNSQGVTNVSYLIQTLTKSIAGQTGDPGRAVVSIVEYYLTSAASSDITRATAGWTTSMQTPNSLKKYLWNYEVITWSSGTITTYVEPVIIGVYGVDGVSITAVDVLYYKSSSSSALTGGVWQTTVPAWTDGYYIWSKTKTSYSIGNPTETTAVCITGGKGTTGKGISSIIEEYNISTSKVAPTNSSWTTTPPAWSWGKYIWTRSKITYTDNSVVYTEQICDSSWDAVNELWDFGENLIVDNKLTLTAGSNNYKYGVLLGSEFGNYETAINALATDGTLTPAEKQTLNNYWNAIKYEKTTICWNSDNKEKDNTDYVDVYNQLGGLLAPLLQNMNVSSSISNSSLYYYLSEYYAARQYLLEVLNVYLKNGKTYTFSVGSIATISGSPTGVKVGLNDFTSNTWISTTILSISANRQFFTFTVPATGYYSLLIYAGIDGNTANNTVAYDKLMLQEGSKATMYKPYDYLKDAFTRSTTVTGGVTLGSIMGVMDYGGNTVAYMNGTNANPTAFAAGVENFGTETETKKIDFRHDGAGHLAGGNINWDADGNTEYKGNITAKDSATGAKTVIDASGMSIFNPTSIYPNIKIGLKNGYAVLEYYDNAGKLLYDLGPNGITYIQVVEEKWLPVDLVQLSPLGYQTILTNDAQKTIYKNAQSKPVYTAYQYISKVVAGVKQDTANDGRIFRVTGNKEPENRIMGYYCRKQAGSMVPTTNSGNRFNPVGISEYNEAVYDRSDIYRARLIRYDDGVEVSELYAYWNIP